MGHCEFKEEKDMKRERFTCFLCCLTLSVAAMFTMTFVSCSKSDSGSGYLRLEIDGSSMAVSKAERSELPDTNDFILKITASDGSVVYSGPYGMAPEKITVPSGSCNVSVRSAEFSRPQFSAPQYGDDICTVVPAGGTVAACLECRQLNSGMRLKIDPEFLVACPEGVLFLRSDKGRLMYGYSEKRIAYFLPGSVSLILSSGASETVLMTRTLEPREILTVNVGIASSSPDAERGISIQLDTSRIWSDEKYEIGAEEDKGTGVGNPMSVPQAKSSIGETDVWVEGYIVGGDLTSSSEGISFSPPFKSSTNIAIAARGSTDSKSSCIAVQLPAGEIRERLSLAVNPGNLGHRVAVNGDIVESYFGITGIKNVTDFVLK